MSQMLPILSAAKLFELCKIDDHFSELRTIAGFDTAIFNVLIADPLKDYAELVQLAPASEAHHHSGPGGLLKHTLDVATLALKKRKGYQLPLGGSLTDIGKQRLLWTYAVFVGCLLHDIGKLSANTRLVAIDKSGKELSWTPSSGPLTTLVDKDNARIPLQGYRIEFRKTPYRYHEHLALIHWNLLPRSGRAWLIEAPHIMAELTAWLWGDKFESGTIGQIIEYADRESTAKNLQVPPDHRFSNVIPAIERYLKLLRQWIQDGAIRINTNGGMGWVDEHGHLYLVCRSLAEKLIQECNSLGLKNLPQDPVRVYDILQEHGYALSTDDGKAIWTIAVETETYRHQFTCLKFESRRLIPSSRELKSLDGVISIQEPGSQEPAKSVTESALQENGQPLQSMATGGDRETAEYIQEAGSDQETASTISTQDTINEATDSTVLETESSTGNDEVTQETATASDTVKDTQENAGPVKTSVSIIKNLEFEAPDTAQKFLSWLQRGLLEKTIVMNNPGAEVHIVEEGIFLLAPAIFKTFLRLHDVPEEKHKNLSKRFASLRKHIRCNDLNIHPYWVSSSNRATKINGWLLPFNVIYENDYPIPKPNKYIKKNLGGENGQ